MSGREEAIADDVYGGDAEDGIVSRSVRYLFHQVGGGEGPRGEGWMKVHGPGGCVVMA